MNQPDCQQSYDRRRRGISLRSLVAYASICLTTALAFAYLLRPDGCAALTVWPVLTWPMVALIPLVACLRRRAYRSVWLAIGAWILFAVVLAEEPRSLLRFRGLDSPEWRAAAQAKRAFRLVSLNCAGGSVEAMRETASLHPDVILLQESPTSREVASFAHDVFGKTAGVIVGFDASIIVRGRIMPQPLPMAERAYFVRATAVLNSGPTVDLVSLRLPPACVRTDLYSPQAWVEHAENRRFRRRQLQAVVDDLRRVPPAAPAILGGDFNAPQDDAVLDLLRPSLSDVFKSAGSGHGNTITNDMPVLRIDQVWADRRCRPVAVRSIRTINSDHRMVVADIIVDPPQ